MTGTIAVGGASTTVTIPRIGQRARITFEGTAGQRLSLGGTNMTIGSIVARILAPDGTTQVALGGAGGGNWAIDTIPLPTSGTYAILIQPYIPFTGSVTLTLSEEVTGTIDVGGGSVPVNITRPGQRARLTFAGTAEQRLSLGATANTFTSATAAFYKPDSTTLVTPTTLFPPNWAVDTPVLPSTGTYQVMIDPGAAYTGNITLTLSEEVTATITPGGPSVTASITRAGQRARLSFSGTAGQRVSLKLTSITLPQAMVTLYNPDGSVLNFPGFPIPNNPSFIDPVTLPVTGTYAILIDPGYAYTGNVTATLYDVPADVTGPITINGGAVPVTLSVPGQKADLTFPGTSGQQITIVYANSTMGCVYVYLIKPTGSSSWGPCTASFNISVTLNATGTHTVRIDPVGANTGSMNVSVTSP